ncbi:MAG TPA: ribosomal protein S18-alanine N-acetyltransferase [Patescibacteria group bacterium]|nr:ribosomal protein S18-alanine N-acetyltransferase [Patescibacteria group bacterium]
MEGLTIRPLQESDSAAIERITRQAPQAAAWPAESYAGLPGWVAETPTGAVGFVVARSAADEMEILNLAVLPAARRRGVATALLRAALDHGRRAGSRRAYLEVRESNQAARRLYERSGFVIVARRPRYYRYPEESALLMALTLPDSQ